MCELYKPAETIVNNCVIISTDIQFRDELIEWRNNSENKINSG